MTTMPSKQKESSTSTKSWLRLAFEALPFHEFLERICHFMRTPEIKGSKPEESSLRHSGQNFITSLFLVSAVVTFVQYLLPHLFEIDLGQLINPLYLALLLAIQAIIFAFILGFFSSISLLPRKPAFHHLVIHQTIQAYAVLNLLVVILFWIVINRILETGDPQEASSTLDLWLGGIIGAVTLWLIWRLLFRPLWRYTTNYYTKKTAFGITAIALISTSWANSYIAFDLSSLVINKTALCKQLYTMKKQRGEIDQSVDEQCFMGHCLSFEPSKP
ncbi:hypothetical protein [Thauera sp. SDU_THAU2]|uniref:hypothetical protein n=1 Tax=Thauera sp. SDU_THAU2 TaxID=3136633 RepID=UPI00311EEC7C